jgi:hypothetical protein
MSATAAAIATHGRDGDGSSSGGGGEETFRQIPINALMDHNDDIRRVCDDFTRALKCVPCVCIVHDVIA